MNGTARSIASCRSAPSSSCLLYRRIAFGWPTGEATPVVAGASMLDAARRALRGDFKGRRGRIAFALTVLAWGFRALG